ncbi:MAG: hypothetical protein M3O46_06730 [Myxococcota bacterium]|nr:hypothetical protein [Myxococcota bacterium]
MSIFAKSLISGRERWRPQGVATLRRDDQRLPHVEEALPREGKPPPKREQAVASEEAGLPHRGKASFCERVAPARAGAAPSLDEQALPRDEQGLAYDEEGPRKDEAALAHRMRGDGHRVNGVTQGLGSRQLDGLRTSHIQWTGLYEPFAESCGVQLVSTIALCHSSQVGRWALLLVQARAWRRLQHPFHRAASDTPGRFVEASSRRRRNVFVRQRAQSASAFPFASRGRFA